MGNDWQETLLRGAARVEVAATGRNPAAWPGYVPGAALSVFRLTSGPVAAVWDFAVHGGSFGEDDATAFAAAAGLAAQSRVPLLSIVRSGGTRLQEGMAALVGIPRARLALLALARAGVPHLAVADVPTTGGVWIAVVAGADVRIAVAGATVGFAGPRVVHAVTGRLPGDDSHTASSAHRDGLVDAVLPGEEVPGWLTRVLTTLTPAPEAVPLHEPPAPVARSGWAQVQASRGARPSGADLLARLTDRIELRAPHGDDSVAAVVARLSGRPVVAVAVAAQRHGRPTPDGYRLLRRGAELADRLGLPLLSLVDTPGAEPGPAAERDGVAAAIGGALDAVLTCRSPVLVLVHGEGGSGGALAAAAGDRVLMSADSYFAAIGPEGAAAALRRPAAECADLMRLTPADLMTAGVCDGLADWGSLAAHLDDLSSLEPQDRLRRRADRWSAPVPYPL